MITITPVQGMLSPAFNNITYTITTDTPAQSITAEIRDSSRNSTIAKKLLKGASEYTIDVAPYVRGEIKLAPMTFAPAPPYAAGGRSIVSCVKAGESIGEAVHTLGYRQFKENGKMSDAPAARSIGTEEQDEITFVANSGTLRTVITLRESEGGDMEIDAVANTIAKRDVVAVAVNAMYVDTLCGDIQRRMNEFAYMEVRICLDGNEVENVRYRIDKNEGKGVRLCWKNPYGAVDYYTFPNITESAVEVEKTKTERSKESLCREEGYRITRKAISAPLAREAAEWLAQVTAATDVWMVKEGAFVPVNILTERIITENSERPVAVEIIFTEKSV